MSLELSSDASRAFKDLLNKKYKSIILKLANDNKEIIVDKTIDSSQSHDTFLMAFPKDKCRYAIYEYPYTNKEGDNKQSLVFIIWTPENVRLNMKTAYTLNKSTVKNYFSGVSLEISASDILDIDSPNILDKILEKQ